MGSKIFRGDRTIDGAEVTVDGQPLDPRLALRTFTDHGFDWSYEGASPRQLALAILAEHLDDENDALGLAEAFMLRVVANFNNEWEMSSADIDAAITNIRATG